MCLNVCTKQTPNLIKYGVRLSKISHIALLQIALRRDIIFTKYLVLQTIFQIILLMDIANLNLTMCNIYFYVLVWLDFFFFHLTYLFMYGFLKYHFFNITK